MSSNLLSALGGSSGGGSDDDVSTDGNDSSPPREESDDADTSGGSSNATRTSPSAGGQIRPEDRVDTSDESDESLPDSGQTYSFGSSNDYRIDPSTGATIDTTGDSDSGSDDYRIDPSTGARIDTSDDSDDSGQEDDSSSSSDGGGGGGFSVGIPGTDVSLTTDSDDASVYDAGGAASGLAEGMGRSALDVATGDYADAAGNYGEAWVDVATGGESEEWRQAALDQEGGLDAPRESIRENLEEGGTLGNLKALNDAVKVGLDVGVADNPTGPNLQSGANTLLQAVTPASDAEDVAGGIERTYSSWREMRSAPADALGISEDNAGRQLAGWGTEVFVEDPIIGATQFLTGADPETGETNTRAEPIDVIDAALIGGPSAASGSARGVRGLFRSLRSGSDDAASATARTGQATDDAASQTTDAAGAATTGAASTEFIESMPPGLRGAARVGRRLLRTGDEAQATTDDVTMETADVRLSDVEVGTGDDVIQQAEPPEADEGVLQTLDQAGATPSSGTSVDDTVSGTTQADDWAQETPDDVASRIGGSIDDASQEFTSTVDEAGDSIPGASEVGISDDALEETFGGTTSVPDEGATLSDNALVEAFGGTNAIDDVADFGSADDAGRSVAGGASSGPGGPSFPSASGGLFDDILSGSSGADEGATAADDMAASPSDGPAQMGPIGSLLDTIESGLGIGRYADEGGSALDDVASGADETGDATDSSVASAMDEMASGADDAGGGATGADEASTLDGLLDDMPGSSGADDTAEEAAAGGVLNPANWSRWRQAAVGIPVLGVGAAGGLDAFGMLPDNPLGAGVQSGDYGVEQTASYEYNGTPFGWQYRVMNVSGGGQDVVGYAIVLASNIHRDTDFIDEHNPFPVLGTDGRPTTVDPLSGSGQSAVPQGRFGSPDQADDAWSSFETWLDENFDAGGTDGSDDPPSTGGSEMFRGGFDPPSPHPVGESFSVPYDVQLRSGVDSAESTIMLGIGVDGRWSPLAETPVALSGDENSTSGTFEVPSGWGGIEPGDYDVALLDTDGGQVRGSIDEASVEFTGSDSGGESAWNEFEIAEQWPNGWYLMVQTHSERDEQRFVVSGNRSDGTTIYLQPDGRASQSPHTYPTVGDAAEAFDRWAERAQSGNTDEGDSPDPNAGRPSTGEVTEAVEGRSFGGILDRAYSFARRNPAMTAGGLAVSGIVLYYLYTEGYLDGPITTVNGVLGR